MISGGMAPCHSCGTGFSSSLLPNAAQIVQLRDILRSNTVPLNLSTFGGTISAAPAELDRYDAEITRLEYHLKRLGSERQSLVAYTDGCRSIFSPVRRLPAEILAEIFDMCSPTEIYHVSRHTTPQQEVERLSGRHLLQLAQVSSSWYHVAMETARLWSTIVVDTSLWDDCAPAAHTLLSLLEASLNRGGNHPLFVQVYCSEFDFHQLSVVQLLSEHAPRWQDVFLASDADPSEYPTGAKGNLGRLEKLHIAGSWKRVDIFREAPRLTEITLRGEIDNVPDLPWAQLLTFTYFGAPAADCFSLLTHGSNIRTATFRIDSRGMDFPEPRQLTSSDVRSITFELAVDTSLHVGRFFDSLTLPCLESFAFCRHDDATIQPIWAQNQFLALAHRSQFNTHLTRLEIHAVITDEELLNCLAVLSKLEELEISDSPGEDHILITDTLLRGLLYEPAATTLVSHLQFLHLTSVLGFTDALYRAVVISRVEEVTLEPGGVFETQLWWYAARHHDVSADTLDSLAALHAEGRLGFHSGIVSPDGTAEPDCVEGQGDTSADGDDTSSADADRWYYCESSTERDLLASMDREYEADPDAFIRHHRDSD